jgi:hypothetical protein
VAAITALMANNWPSRAILSSTGPLARGHMQRQDKP